MRPPPDTAAALHALGHLYLTQGFPKQALALLTSARRAGAPSPTLDRAIAVAYLDLDRPDRALTVIDRLETSLIGAADRRAHSYLRARALLGLGRGEEARRVFDGPGETS